MNDLLYRNRSFNTTNPAFRFPILQAETYEYIYTYIYIITGEFLFINETKFAPRKSFMQIEKYFAIHGLKTRG